MSDLKVDNIYGENGTAGPKFPGGIRGQTDGAGEPAGYLGEVISVNPTSNGQQTQSGDTAINAWTTSTNELSLTAGIWSVDIQAGIWMVANTATTSIAGTVSLYNVTDATTVSRSNIGFGDVFTSAGTGHGVTGYNKQVISIDTSTTYRLQIQINQANATAYAQLYGSASPSGSGNTLQTNMTAIRIA